MNFLFAIIIFIGLNQNLAHAQDSSCLDKVSGRWSCTYAYGDDPSETIDEGLALSRVAGSDTRFTRNTFNLKSQELGPIWGAELRTALAQDEQIQFFLSRWECVGPSLSYTLVAPSSGNLVDYRIYRVEEDGTLYVRSFFQVQLNSVEGHCSRLPN